MLKHENTKYTPVAAINNLNGKTSSCGVLTYAGKYIIRTNTITAIIAETTENIYMEMAIIFLAAKISLTAILFAKTLNMPLDIPMSSMALYPTMEKRANRKSPN